MSAPELSAAVAAPAAAPGAAAAWRNRIGAYVALTKPRIIELLLVTTVPAMLLAARDAPGISPGRFAWLLIATLVAGTLAAGSANAINCYWDRDIDRVMSRTRRRPLPAQSVSPPVALAFGLVLGAVACLLLALLVNLLAAALTALAIAIYVVVYTIWLKRTSVQNIVIGGAAGALPPMIGWAAVRDEVALVPLILFLIVFLWTPPHFWALSIRLQRDYRAAGVPMLPVVRGVEATNREILRYAVVLVGVTLVLVPVASMGLVYTGSAILLGAWFLRETGTLWHVGTPARAIRVYRASITYLALLFAAIGVDALLIIRP
ncbi:MAG TPA: heme o synthase [Candidatus Limnocylindria bacterium]